MRIFFLSDHQLQSVYVQFIINKIHFYKDIHTIYQNKGGVKDKNVPKMCIHTKLNQNHQFFKIYSYCTYIYKKNIIHILSLSCSFNSYCANDWLLFKHRGFANHRYCHMQFFCTWLQIWNSSMQLHSQQSVSPYCMGHSSKWKMSQGTLGLKTENSTTDFVCVCVLHILTSIMSFWKMLDFNFGLISGRTINIQMKFAPLKNIMDEIFAVSISTHSVCSSRYITSK